MLQVLFVLTSMAQISSLVNYSPAINIGAYSQCQSDGYSFVNNQAALTSIECFGMAVCQEKMFNLSEINKVDAIVAIPTSLGNLGCSIGRKGFEGFSETNIGLAYARKLSNAISIGTQFNYYSFKIPSYFHSASMNIEIGTLIRFSPKLNAGIHVFNPVRMMSGNNDDNKLPYIYTVGVGYDVSNDFFICIEIVKQEDQAIDLVGGIQYQFDKRFFLKLGFMSENSSLFSSLGVVYNSIRLEALFRYHPQLGYSPGLLLSTHFKHK